MVKKCIRLGALLLALVLTVTLVPLPRAHAADADLTAIVEKQIRAYADSIDQRNADGDAAWALANHGINGGGKKLTAGASHPLTATLMNSELLQDGLTRGCTELIYSMQRLAEPDLYASGGCSWNSGTYYLTGFPDEQEVDTRKLFYTGLIHCNNSLGGYDSSLEWMAGSTNLKIKIERLSTGEETITYQVTARISDRFDFATASNSGFKNLISAIGALLFREFDWESTVSFEVTAPYSCTHSSANYRWEYDPNTYTITSRVSDEYIENEVFRKTQKAESSTEQYYHELTSTAWLLHNREWAVEYIVKGYAYFALSSRGASPDRPSLLHAGGNGAYFVYSADENLTAEEQESLGLSSPFANCLYRYGRSFDTDFANSYNHSYTYRYENDVSLTGGNTIFLSVYDNTLQKQVLRPTPLEQYQRIVKGIVIDSYNDSDWLSGKDFPISSIGNRSYALNNCDFELYIWENGEGGESFDYFETKTVAPTCTEDGYTAHTCAACGYSYKTDIVPALGHKYKAKVTEPTCTEDGYTTYTCSVCKDSYTGDTVKALKHSYGAGYCSRCGDDTVTAVITDGTLDLRATRGIKVGTWVLLCGYTTDGRMMGCKAQLWDGTPQTIDLPEGENFTLFFVKEGTWVPLRNLITPQ